MLGNAVCVMFIGVENVICKFGSNSGWFCLHLLLGRVRSHFFFTHLDETGGETGPFSLVREN